MQALLFNLIASLRADRRRRFSVTSHFNSWGEISLNKLACSPNSARFSFQLRGNLTGRLIRIRFAFAAGKFPGNKRRKFRLKLDFSARLKFSFRGVEKARVTTEYEFFSRLAFGKVPRGSLQTQHVSRRHKNAQVYGVSRRYNYQVYGVSRRYNYQVYGVLQRHKNTYVYGVSRRHNNVQVYGVFRRHNYV
jgi:hypothetical protein